jgi:hypothetical protein
MLISLVKDCIFLGALTIGYFTYIELNPKTKGIVFRPNDRNELVLSTNSIKAFILFPLTSDGLQIMWRPENYDINFPLILVSSYGIYKFIL